MPRWGTSNEYQQHMFSWTNKKNLNLDYSYGYISALKNPKTPVMVKQCNPQADLVNYSSNARFFYNPQCMKLTLMKYASCQIRVFAACLKKPCSSGYPQSSLQKPIRLCRYTIYRLWYTDRVNIRRYTSLCWVHSHAIRYNFSHPASSMLNISVLDIKRLHVVFYLFFLQNYVTSYN